MTHGGRPNGERLAAGWVVGVLVEDAEGLEPSQNFYAVNQPDRAQAEWAAVDRAMTIGPIASSPFNGQEPVKALGRLSPRAAAGLGPGQVKDLGQRWPRRWIV